MSAEHDDSEDNATDSDSDDNGPKTVQHARPTIRPPPLMALQHASPMSRTASNSGVDDDFPRSYSPHSSTPLPHGLDPYPVGPNYVLHPPHSASRSRTPVMYAHIKSDPDGAQGHGQGHGQAGAGAGEQMYSIQHSADQAINPVMAPLMHQLPVRLMAASGNYPNPAVPMRGHNHGREAYYEAAMERTSSMHCPPRTDPREPDLTPSYPVCQANRVCQALAPAEKDLSMTGLPQPAQAVHEAPATQAQSVYDTVPYIEPMGVAPPAPVQPVPYNFNRTYTPFHLNLGIGIDGEIKELDLAYPLPSERTDQM